MNSNSRQKPSFGGKQAIVIGGSMAGLLAARVLSDHFEKVILIEKDQFADHAAPRKGVPQGLHAHTLWKKGENILAEYFPGFFEDLMAAGAHNIDIGSELIWFAHGAWKQRLQNTGLTMYSMTRTLLEWKVRCRVKALANVHFMEGYEVKTFLNNPSQTQVIGVKIAQNKQLDQDLTADLVIDTSGRGSRTPQWLEAMGYARVAEVNLNVNVGYASRLYSPPEGFHPDWKTIAIFPNPPHGKRQGYLFAIEGNRWIVSLAGEFGDHPPTDEAGYLEYARSLPAPAIYEMIKDAQPVTPIASHKIPSNLWRRYDRMAKFPEGLLVSGDAVCSFNPIYGQGMSVSAMDAKTLDECLQRQAASKGQGNVKGLAQEFHKKVAKNIANSWLLATGEDSRFPEAEGNLPGFMPILNRYTGKVQALTNHDPKVLLKFLRVLSMDAAPTTLFAPGIAFKVFTVRPKKVSASSQSQAKLAAAKGSQE